MPSGRTNSIKALTLSASPVTSTVTARGPMSTTWARKAATIESSSARVRSSTETFTITISRSMVLVSLKSVTLITQTSLLSCLLICSSVWSSPVATRTMRETVGSSGSSLTVKDSILKPRLENRPATRASTPNSFSTRTDMVWLGISCGYGPGRPARAASLVRLLLMAMKEFHDAILRGQLQLLNSFLFDFLFGGQVVLQQERFELAFELRVLLIQRLQFFVIGHVLMNEFFFLRLHLPSLPRLEDRP